jgi:hypothetical protein
MILVNQNSLKLKEVHVEANFFIIQIGDWWYFLII